VEIKLNHTNASDQITIRTQFSSYSFRVTDPLTCRGLLSGGSLGDQPEDAYFAGAISRASRQPHDATRLITGCHAVFFVGRKDLTRLTTSIVTKINLSATQAEACGNPE